MPSQMGHFLTSYDVVKSVYPDVPPNLRMNHPAESSGVSPEGNILFAASGG